MSAFDRAYSAIKAAMLTSERFDGIDQQLKALSRDLKDLAASHAGLGQRVSNIEGYLRAASGAPFTSSSAPRIGHD